MYLVWHMRGTASELGLKTAFSFTQQYSWNAKQKPAEHPVGAKLEIE